MTHCWLRTPGEVTIQIQSECIEISLGDHVCPGFDTYTKCIASVFVSTTWMASCKMVCQLLTQGRVVYSEHTVFPKHENLTAVIKMKNRINY